MYLTYCPVQCPGAVQRHLLYELHTFLHVVRSSFSPPCAMRCWFYRPVLYAHPFYGDASVKVSPQQREKKKKKSITTRNKEVVLMFFILQYNPYATLSSCAESSTHTGQHAHTAASTPALAHAQHAHALAPTSGRTHTLARLADIGRSSSCGTTRGCLSPLPQRRRRLEKQS